MFVVLYVVCCFRICFSAILLLDTWPLVVFDMLRDDCVFCVFVVSDIFWFRL